MTEPFLPVGAEQPPLEDALPPLVLPKEYEVDSGIALTYDTLCNRGHDPEVVRLVLDAYGGDLWMDVFGPAIDRAAEAVGLTPYPEDDDD